MEYIFPPLHFQSVCPYTWSESLSFFFFNFIYLFIFGCVGPSLLHEGFSLVAASGGYSSLQCMGFSLRWLLLLQSTGPRCMGFSSCGTRAQQLWRTGLVAPQHVGSSRTRARTRVPCIGRWILNHCATREALKWVSCRQRTEGSCFLFVHLLYFFWLENLVHLHFK